MKHSMLLWKKPSSELIDIQISQVFEVLSIFVRMGGIFTPRYMTVRKKKQAKEFYWELNNFSNQIKKHPVNAGNRILGELGYRMSFFSSLNDENSISFSIMIGNQNPMFTDAIVINFPSELSQSNFFISNMPNIFRECCEIFHPYWGCIADMSYTSRYGSYLNKEDKLPSGVHWVNYWSEEIVEKHGCKKILTALANENILFLDGFFTIRHTPVDITSQFDMELCDLLNARLGIS